MKTMHRIFFAVLLASGISLSVNGKANEPWFSQAELDQMLAPVALYPDTVLSHVLIAATYPLEVIQAARWSRANPGLSGEAAVAAVEHMEWDPSVMALAAFPELLARMDEDIEWTHRLGDAFMVQEPEVIDTIQQLRERAYAAGNLKTNEQVRVVRETRYIHIEPARPRVVYVPYYDPYVVYGNWWWSSHPPVIWRHRPRHVASVNFYWGPAYHVAPAFYFSSFHWSRRQVVVVNHHHHHHHHRHFRSGREVARYSDARHWQHNPQHRRGVSYHRGVSEQRFAQRQSGSTPSAPVRSAQPRNNQREWAADRRSSMNLNERQSVRSTNPQATQAQRATRQASSASARTDQAQRQRTAHQGERTQSQGLARGEAARTRANAPDARQRAPERSARQLQDNLAGSRGTAATRNERPATSSAAATGRARPSAERQRSANSAAGSDNQAIGRQTRERASAPGTTRQASTQSRSAPATRSPSVDRSALNRSEPAAAPRAAPQASRQAPAQQQRSAPASSAPRAGSPAMNRGAPEAASRPSPAPRSQQRAPSRPASSPQSRPQPAAAPAPRSAPAPRAAPTQQRAAPTQQRAAPTQQRAAPTQQRAAPAQRDSGASRARSRER